MSLALRSRTTTSSVTRSYAWRTRWSVDLMGRACGISYAEAVSDAETLEREGVSIRLASPATFIRTPDVGNSG